MIDADWARLMARYNRWQSDSLYTAAGTLDDAERRATDLPFMPERDR